MMQLLIGAFAGFLGGYAMKGQSAQKESRNEAGISYASLLQEAQKNIEDLKNRLRNQQEENNTLTAEIQTLKQKIRNADEASDDQADIVADLQRRVETLKREKELMEEKSQEYKELYEAATMEIEKLKNKD